jgi:3-methyladenine DNA glycosylase Mpg
MNKVVRASFFKRDPLTCARELIGTELIWSECSGVVVEVEAYAAIDDEAAHTFTRPSARSFIERNKAGRGVRLFQLRRSLDVKRAGEGRRELALF